MGLPPNVQPSPPPQGGPYIELLPVFFDGRLCSPGYVSLWYVALRVKVDRGERKRTPGIASIIWYVCVYVCLHVCTYAVMYLCTYVCMYVRR